MHSDLFIKVKRLNTCTSIFTADVHAMSIAIDAIFRAKIKQAVLYVDSRSAFTAICSLKVTIPVQQV